MAKSTYTNTKEFQMLDELPGKSPYTRGIYSEMYSKRLWTMRQYAGFGDSKTTNERFRYLINQGQTGLSVAFDLPTQLGYDSDHPLSKGEVGKVGVAIDTLADMESLFHTIPLGDVSVSMTINATAIIIFAMYLVVAEKQGISYSALTGTIQNDILKEYVARGTYIFPPKPSLRLITDIFAFCKEQVPKWNTISISGYHIREAGATAIQEVAITIANGVEYITRAIQSGLDIDEFAPRLSFFFSSDNGFFEEIAKFRAARRVWSEIMERRFQPKLEKSKQLRFHTQTAGSTLTAQQPLNNIVRVTIQALSAILGGTQSLHTNSYDEALGLPSEEAVTVALRTQQILAYETGVPAVSDPLGGSYYIESLTQEYVSKIYACIGDIEEHGGVIQSIEDGYIQDLIQQSAYAIQIEIEESKRNVVGLTVFTNEGESDSPVFTVNPAVEMTQTMELSRIKESRDAIAVSDALAKLKNACKSEANIMPLVIEAVKSYATIGEISDIFRSEFGEYHGTHN